MADVSIGKLRAELELSAGNFHREMASATQSIKTAGQTAETTGHQVQSAGPKVNALGNAFAEVTKQAVAFTAALVAVEAGRAVLDKLSSTVERGFKFDSLQQGSKLAFETLMGDADLARQHLADLTKFAADTPFKLTGVIDESQKLQALGFQAQAAIPMLTSIGDAMAGLNKGQEGVDRVVMALGQMNAKGKAQAEEMMQLTELGIPAWQALATAIGTDVPTAMDRVSKGAVDSQTAIAAVLTSMDSTFGGLMAKQSQTAAGLLSTLEDTFDQAAGQVFEPFFRRVQAGMVELSKATNTPEFHQGLDAIAEGLDTFLTHAEAVFQALGTGEGLREALDAMDKLMGDWAQSFGDWVRPAAEAMLEQLDRLGAVVGAWIADKAQDIAEDVLTHWIPPFVDWILNDALPKVLERLRLLGGGILTWVEKEGAGLMLQAGLKMGEAYRNAWLNAIKGAFEAVQREIASHTMASPEERAAGYANFDPDILSGGVKVPKSVADANVKAAMDNWNAYQASLQGDAPTPTAPAGPGGRERVNWAQMLADMFGPARGVGEVPDHVKTSAAKAGAKVAESALDGFMRAAVGATSKLEAQFGELAGKGVSALEVALHENSGGAGAALRGVVEDLTTRAREAGLSNFQELGDELAGRFYQALAQRDSPAAKQAAIEMIQQITEEIAAQSRLTTDRLFSGLEKAQGLANLGSAGGALFGNLQKAQAEGGANNIDAFATSIVAMRRQLLEQFPPEEAEAWMTSIMDAITGVMERRGPEAEGELRGLLAAVDFAGVMGKASEKLITTINVAIDKTHETITKAKDDAEKQIKELRASFDQQEGRATIFEQIAKDAKSATDALRDTQQAAQRVLQTTREDRDLRQARDREDAEIALRRDREDAERLRKARVADTSSVGGQGRMAQAAAQGLLTGPRADPMYEAFRAGKEQDAKRAQEDADLKRRREQQDADRVQRRADQAEDQRISDTNKADLAGIAATYETLRRNFEATFKREDLNKQITAILDKATSVETAANQALTDTMAAAQAEFDKVQATQVAIRDFDWATLQSSISGLFTKPREDLEAMDQILRSVTERMMGLPSGTLDGSSGGAGGGLQYVPNYDHVPGAMAALVTTPTMIGAPEMASTQAQLGAGSQAAAGAEPMGGYPPKSGPNIYNTVYGPVIGIDNAAEVLGLRRAQDLDTLSALGVV